MTSPFAKCVIPKECLIMTYNERLQILANIESLVKFLKEDLAQEQVSLGLCSHEQIKDMTTFEDLAQGVRKGYCIRCREIITERVDAIVSKDK